MTQKAVARMKCYRARAPYQRCSRRSAMILIARAATSLQRLPRIWLNFAAQQYFARRQPARLSAPSDPPRCRPGSAGDRSSPDRPGLPPALSRSLPPWQDYDQAIKLNPSHANAFYNRGVAKAGMGDKKGAEADLAAARRINPWAVGGLRQ